MKSLAGTFLVASPQLSDPNFSQTAVLMIDHSEQGALGLVLNRPSQKSVGEVWEIIGKPPCDTEEPVFVGGPVPGPLMALHSHSQFSDQQLLPGLFLTAQESLIDSIVSQRAHPFRLFSGHAGWGGGQLEGEMKVSGWLTTPATADDVFGDHQGLWGRLTSRIGIGILAPGLRPDQLPKDPGLN